MLPDKPIKVDLQTTTNITTTYAGEFAGQYIAAALLSGVTLGNQLITIKPNVKYKEVVKRLSNADIVADSTCDFTPTGTVTLDERILEPKELQVNQQLCKNDFVSDWEAVQMGYSAHDNLPPNFQQFFISHMIALVGQANETTIWQGVGTNGGEYDGFTPLFQADSNVIDHDNPDAITAANVITKLEEAYALIPQEIYGTDDLMIYASPIVCRSYNIALGGFGAQGLGAAGYMSQGTVGEKPLNFAGIPMAMVNGMPANEFVIAQKRNLWFGTGLLSDQNEVKVLDMADIDGSRNVRFVMRYTGGVQYGYGSEIVYSWNATP